MIAQITIENNICENPSHAKSQSGLLNGWGGGGAAVHRVLPELRSQHSTLQRTSMHPLFYADTDQSSVVPPIKGILH